VNKKISNIQRFLTLLFTDKDIRDTAEESETPTVKGKTKKIEVLSTEEKTVKIDPKDI